MEYGLWIMGLSIMDYGVWITHNPYSIIHSPDSLIQIPQSREKRDVRGGREERGEKREARREERLSPLVTSSQKLSVGLNDSLCIAMVVQLVCVLP